MSPVSDFIIIFLATPLRFVLQHSLKMRLIKCVWIDSQNYAWCKLHAFSLYIYDISARHTVKGDDANSKMSNTKQRNTK